MEILLWISLITGGLLFLLLILSLIGGLDLDLDIGDTDMDADGGGLGAVKSVLTFVSMSTYIMRVLLITATNPILAVVIGLSSGALAVLILSLLLKFLLSQQSNVNYTIDDTMFKSGKVYLRIPADGEGIIRTNINGVEREFKAKTNEYNDIETGSEILIESVEDGYVVVVSV